MSRNLALALMLAAAGCAHGATGSLDPFFETVPFREWLAGAAQTPFHWNAKVYPPHLSNHQRLITNVEARLDGLELAMRRGKGEFVVMVQFTDSDGRLYQDHYSIDMRKVEEGVKKSDIVYSQPVFLMPGQYNAVIALLATATGEHSVKRQVVHVQPLKNDPLPDAWAGLPPVEFVQLKETPENWFLPNLDGKLSLPVNTPHPVHVEILVNLTPSERASGSFRAQDRNMSVLLPALKALTQIQGSQLSVNVSLVDLSRRKVTFRQQNVRELDWPRMREALSETNPGSIDVKSLEDRQHNAAFFVSEVARRLAGKDAPVVIVLSGPVEFESGQDLSPIDASLKGRVVYIRYHAPMRPPGLSRGNPAMMGRLGMPMPQGGRPLVTDQLEPLLKSLNPELFESQTPEEFRKVLAALLREAPLW